MSGPHQWSETAANNGSSDRNADLRPGRPASTVLGAIRGLMETVALARDDDLGGLVATVGASNICTVSTNEGLIDPTTGVNGIPAAITRPFTIAVTFSAAPTGVATAVPHLVVDNFDCGPILHADGTALADGDLTTGRIYHVLGDMAAVSDTKVTRVRCLEISPNEIAALARAAAAPLIAALGSPVQKTGDTMTGPLVIGFPTPYFDLVYGGVMRSRQIVDGNGNWNLQNGDNGDNFITVTPGGAIVSKQFGDLNTRIESRAQAWATQQAQAYTNNCVQGARWVFAGSKSYFDQPGTGGFISPFGGQAMKCDYWSYQFLDANGVAQCAPYADRYRNLQVYIPNQGWVTVGAAS